MRKAVLAAFGLSVLAVPSLFAAPPTIAQIVKQRVDHLTLLLSLSTTQQADATTIFTTESTANEAPEKQLQMDRKALDAEIKLAAGASPSLLTSDAKAIAADEATISANNSIAEAAFLAILSPADVTKYEKLERRGGGWEGFGAGLGAGGFGARGR